MKDGTIVLIKRDGKRAVSYQVQRVGDEAADHGIIERRSGSEYVYQQGYDMVSFSARELRLIANQISKFNENNS